MRKIEITKREEIVDDKSKGIEWSIALVQYYGEGRKTEQYLHRLNFEDMEDLYEEIGKKLGKNI